MPEDIALLFAGVVWIMKSSEKSTRFRNLFACNSKKQVISGKEAFGGAGGI